MICFGGYCKMYGPNQKRYRCGLLFDRNMNAVRSKVYEDDNDVAVSSVFEAPANLSWGSQRSAIESSSIARTWMDTDLDLSRITEC